MIEVKNFDNWIEDTESGKFGSGASEKLWLVNPVTNERGLFKFPKVKSNGQITGESIDKILAEFDDNIISENMKKLLKIYLIERRKRMLEIYNLKEEV